MNIMYKCSALDDAFRQVLLILSPRSLKRLHANNRR